MNLLHLDWWSSISHAFVNTETAAPMSFHSGAIHIIAATSWRTPQGFKFCCRPEPQNQSFAQQPGRRALDAVFERDHLRLPDVCRGTGIVEGSMQSREVNTRVTCVPVNHGGIPEVLAEDKVRFKEVLV